MNIQCCPRPTKTNLFSFGSYERLVPRYGSLSSVILATGSDNLEYRRFISTVSDKISLRSTCSESILVATKTPQTDAPVLGRGALCADSMGLVRPKYTRL